MMEIPVFVYIKEIDCFVVDPRFKEICDPLGLRGWEQIAWVGRYFSLDNDYGEHWFDNGDLRDKKESIAPSLNIPYEDMLVIDPDRFRNNQDGPCHSDEQRKNFWTSVLKSLTLDIEVIIEEARLNNQALQNHREEYILDLEQRIDAIRARYNAGGITGTPG